MSNTVTVEEIKDTIRGVLCELMEENAVSEISDDDCFAEDMGISSMTIVQIFVTCQEKYNVDLSDEMQLTEPMSIQSLAEIIQKKTNKK